MGLKIYALFLLSSSNSSSSEVDCAITFMYMWLPVVSAMSGFLPFPVVSGVLLQSLNRSLASS